MISLPILQLSFLLNAAPLPISQPDAPPRPDSTPLKGNQPSPPQQPPALPYLPPAAEVFAERLTALDPRRPFAYFLLGEEVADRSSLPEYRTLAATLFVLAFELDRASPRDSEGVGGVGGMRGGQLAASACLALADTARDPRDRLWLSALSRTLEPSRQRPEWTRPAPPASIDAEGYQVATVVGLVRSGEGGRARQLLKKANVADALARQDSLLSRLGLGGSSAIIRESERWICPECANQRITRKGRPDGVEGRLCLHCAGNPGPRLTREQLLAQLRFESWMLQGVQRSWAAQSVADGGAPLHDPDPEGVAQVFNVDPKALYWRNGRWWHNPDGTTPAPTPVNPTPDVKPPPEPATPPTSGS